MLRRKCTEQRKWTGAFPSCHQITMGLLAGAWPFSSIRRGFQCLYMGVRILNRASQSSGLLRTATMIGVQASQSRLRAVGHPSRPARRI